MLDSTYADKAFASNIFAIKKATERTADATEAIANHLAVIAGIMKHESVAKQMLQTDKEGFVRPVFNDESHAQSPRLDR